jgi:hypothetical protein
MDFGRPPATRAADGLIEVPLFHQRHSDEP